MRCTVAAPSTWTLATGVGAAALTAGLTTGLTTALVPGLMSVAHAGPDSEVTSAADADDGFDITPRVAFEYTTTTTEIRRERLGPGADPLAPIPLVRDLVASQHRMRLIPSVEVGVFRGLWLSAALPVTLAERTELAFDQRQTPCGFGPTGDCVNALNSTTVADGLLPMTGFDADDPATGFDPSSDQAFRGVGRAGLDTFDVGVGWAPMRQAVDPTKPTWKLGATLHIAIGEVAEFDRVTPGRNTAVGRGVHEITAWTSFAAKYGRWEPHMRLAWTAPVGLTSGSQFQSPGFGAQRTDPQQRALVEAGTELYLVDNPDEGTRVSLGAAGQAEMAFEGQAYSPIWELLAYAGDARGDGPLILDADPTVADRQALNHPGVSGVENSLRLRGDLAVRAHLGPRVRLTATFGVHGTSDHFVTFSDAGTDLPMCTGGQTVGCEAGGNDLVNPGTEEVNPLHVPLVDLVGHRYRAQQTFGMNLGVAGEFRF